MLVGGALAAIGGGGGNPIARVQAILREQFGARAVALTDSGTSALVLAIGLVAKPGATVALPAYACVDLIAAVARTGMRARLYDIDPATLSPDLGSLEGALTRGADVVVVAHLYGYPADVPAVRTLAARAGARVIEDAAQQAGGFLGATRLGAFGPLTVLSFGRGKGTSGGRGGALLGMGQADGSTIRAIEEWAASAGEASAGWGEVGRAAAQWVFGRPSLYVIPAAIPALHLGETIYRPAGEPGPLSRAAAALVGPALAAMEQARTARARQVELLMHELEDATDFAVVRPIVGGKSGYLRLPVLDTGDRASAPALGVVRSYPRPLASEPALQPLLERGEPEMRGAIEICRTLFTLPTHPFVRDVDRRRIGAWAVPGSRRGAR